MFTACRRLDRVEIQVAHQGKVESRHLACGQLGDPAGAGPTVQELEGVIVEGTEIQSIQAVQRSELRVTNRRSREIRRRGRSLRNKLAAGVQSVFGVDSMALLAFGVKPRLPKPRRRLTPDEKIVKLEAELEVVKAANAAAEKEEGLISL